MIKFLFLTIPHQCTYEQLKSPLKFKQDTYGVTAWTMKYPLTIYSADLKFRHLFKPNEVKIETLSSPASLQQKWRYFVMTKKDGGKYYCTSQIIYVLIIETQEKGLLKMSQNNTHSQFFSSYANNNSQSSQQFYLPKCIVLVSQMPYFKLQVNLLKIHKELKKPQPAISYCIEQDLYQLYLEYLEAGKDKEWDNLNLADFTSKRKTYCPLEVSFSYYVECCNSHLSGECIYIEKITSRQVLHLYKLNPSSLYQIGYFFHLPLSALSLRKLISAILTEKQIVFSSSNPNLTVMVIQTLMQMIQPLKWCYMYAPNMPVQLIEAAQESFMPFIVGVSKQYLPLICKVNKVIVHIDTDQVETNYDQEDEELHLLSKKFEKFLTCKANSNKQYLEWQKQLRINSILMITTIFKKDMPLEKQNGSKKYISEEEKVSQEKFYEDFLSKSMMYRKLIEDIHEKVYSQFYKLTKMDFSDRKTTLQNKFNSIHSQTLYPTKCDNKKEWVKYYQKYMRQKRKTRLNRHSLSMVDHSLIGIGGNSNNGTNTGNYQPFYASNVSLGSINSNQKIQASTIVQNNSQTMFQRNSAQQSTSYKSNFTNARNNELYQSNVSSHSLNSHNSAMRFNIQSGVNNSSSKDILQSHRNTFNQTIQTANFHKNPTFSSSNNLNNPNHFNATPSRNVFLAGNPTTNPLNSTHQSNIFENSFASSQVQNITQTASIYTPQHIQPTSNQTSMINQNTSQSQGNIYSASKNATQNSMIFNSPIQSNFGNTHNPLNQSMVTGYLHSNGQNIHNYTAMNNFGNTSSHRNLNSTQNTFV